MQLSGVDVISLRVVGTLAGVVVICVGALNGTGVVGPGVAGRLISSIGGGGGAQLAWQSPGSATPGLPQPVAPDGNYLLEDGDDVRKFIRVAVYGNFLPIAGAARVYIDNAFNAMGPADVAAADATAGLITTTQYTLTNVSPTAIYNVKLWIDRSGVASRGIAVSSDNVSYFNPASEADPNALTWASIAVGGSVNVWMQRNVPAGATFTPAKFNELEFGWTGL